MAIRSVWHRNFAQEIQSLNSSLHRYRILCLDAEFPGFLRETSRHANNESLYRDLRFNVDHTNLIQLGFTVLDGNGNIGTTWEFNLKFDVKTEHHAKSSIAFLERNGLDFSKINNDGIPVELFRQGFIEMLTNHRDIKWVSFHGIYDMAYMVKLISGNLLPNYLHEFGEIMSSFCDSLFDLKFAAKFYFRGKEFGLESLAKKLGIDRIGEAHNAGSDSLVTAKLYKKFMEASEVRAEMFDGVLYGLEGVRIGRRLKRALAVRRQPMMMVGYGVACGGYLVRLPPPPVHMHMM